MYSKNNQQKIRKTLLHNLALLGVGLIGTVTFLPSISCSQSQNGGGGHISENGFSTDKTSYELKADNSLSINIICNDNKDHILANIVLHINDDEFPAAEKAYRMTSGRMTIKIENIVMSKTCNNAFIEFSYENSKQDQLEKINNIIINVSESESVNRILIESSGQVNSYELPNILQSLDFLSSAEETFDFTDKGGEVHKDIDKSSVTRIIIGKVADGLKEEIPKYFLYNFKSIDFFDFSAWDSIKIINTYAFGYTENLGSINNLPDNVETIAENFCTGSGINQFEFPNKLQYIKNDFFVDCKKLTILSIIPESIRSIGDNFCQNCDKLTRLNIGKVDREKFANGRDNHTLATSNRVSEMFIDGVSIYGDGYWNMWNFCRRFEDLEGPFYRKLKFFS